MAKRKRLTPLGGDWTPPDTSPDTSPNTGAGGPAATGPRPGAPPIAAVAGAASAQAALEDMAQSLERMRAEGRMVLELPLDQVAADHLVRDRIASDEAEMRALMESLAARGQQTPIEVARAGAGYGLISGWRRIEALRRLRAETGEARFGTVLALVRSPGEAGAAYRAMVEENEIRVGLSYYERGRIAVKVVEEGVFPDLPAALSELFATASRSKRSKIGSFARVVQALDGSLRYPQALGERLGLKLAKWLEGGAGRAEALAHALDRAAPDSPEAEQAAIAAALAPPASTAPTPPDPGARARSGPAPGRRPPPGPRGDPAPGPPGPCGAGGAGP